MEDEYKLEINKMAPGFETEAFFDKDIRKLRLSDYKGKWVILFFYPADFTFICPTELGEMADMYEELKKLNVEVLSVSTDTAFVHKAWHDESPTIKKIKFPMVADPSGKICKSYGVYIEDKPGKFVEDEGKALRGTFYIDPDGILKSFEINDNSIGRSSAEVLRKIQAAQFVRENGGEVCPMNWSPGKKTLKPSVDLVGKI